MINTSTQYKTLLDQGAIEEYKIVINGVEYIDDAIYDKISLKQQLFSTDTFSVGGLALAQLSIKLRVPTIDIPRNANIKFYYRLTDLEVHSEWIQKFNGRVSKRKRFTEDVTTIEAISNGANYDIFLDIYPNEISSYPTNNRNVVMLCAQYLGLNVENINDVYDGNNVEYPNELTVVGVLQNIAALSGGNWIITENDTLRLVVLKNTSTTKPTYTAFNIVSEESVQPISRVTMYYQDDKAFTAGDDTGSELTIDCSWATQETTNYVLSLYQGYVYRPVQGVGVAVDGAIQLGDEFQYADGQVQLVAKIDYTFAGSVVANVDAPLSTEGDFDDPYETIVQAPFKRKVSLGDSYQGVTISRDKGIDMVLSPDGTEANAVAKFYSDLQRGMAFQYKDEHTGEWQDWLYFDKDSKIFKLMMYATADDVHAMIQLGLEQANMGQLIYRLNMGDYDMSGWTGTGRLKLIQGLQTYKNLQLGFTATPVKVREAMSEFGVSFFGKEEMLSPWAYRVPRDKFSWRGKVKDFKPFNVTVYEYIDSYNPNTIYMNKGYSQGSISQNTGENINATNRVRADYFKDINYSKITVYKSNANFKFIVRFYDRNNRFIKSSNSYIPDDRIVIDVPTNASRIRVIVARVNDAAINPTQVPNNLISIYDGVHDEPIKNTKYSFTTEQDFYEFSIEPENQTNFFRLGFDVPTATLDNRATFYDMMFNAEAPMDWYESPQEAINFAKSSIQVLSNQINLQANEIDGITGDLHSANLEVNARDGITTRGRMFRVLSSDGNTTYMEVNENGLFVQDATISGNLAAGTIAGLIFDASKVTFPDGELALDSAKNALMFGTTQMKFERSSFTSGGQTHYSDDVVIRTTNGQVRFGDFTSPQSPTPVMSMRGIDSIDTMNVLNSSGALLLGSYQSGVNPVRFSGHLLPHVNNAYDLGSTSLRVRRAYYGSQPSVSSDVRYKNNIMPVDDEFMEIFAREVKPKTFSMFDKDDIHFGYIAQDIERALYKYTLSKYGLNEAKKEVEKFALLEKDESYMSLLYGEIAVLMDAYNRKKIESLEERVTRLEELLERMI